MWHYNRNGETSSPKIVLRTRRSLRAVHFHPHGAPFLLTAEVYCWSYFYLILSCLLWIFSFSSLQVNDLDLSDSAMTIATCPGYTHYPPPSVYMADTQSSDHPITSEESTLVNLPFSVWPSLARDEERSALQHSNMDGPGSRVQQGVDSSASVRLLTFSTPSGQYELLLSPVEPTNSSSQQPVEERTESIAREIDSTNDTDNIGTLENQNVERSNLSFRLGDPTCWELPFLQGWLVGQSQAQHMTGLPDVSASENAATLVGLGTAVTSSIMPTVLNQSRVSRRSSSGERSSQPLVISTTGSSEGSAFINIPRNESGSDPVRRFQSEFATSLAATAAAELPCTVKLRIWPHDIDDPCTPLEGDNCCFSIPHAVLCRYNLLTLLHLLKNTFSS